MAFRNTSDYAGLGGMHVDPTGSAFARAVRDVVRESWPSRIVETGTFLGSGTTAIIGDAIRDADWPVTFYSIEANPRFHVAAMANVGRTGNPARLLLGLSVPRAMLPCAADVAADLGSGEYPDGTWADYPDDVRAEAYVAETDTGAAADALGNVLRAWDGRPDLVLLDSAGHLGFAEFRYAVGLLRGPCVIVLDDTRHVKHCRSLAYAKARPEAFAVVAESDEKFGFAILRYNPPL